jgi:hypothetical protein
MRTSMPAMRASLNDQRMVCEPSRELTAAASIDTKHRVLTSAEMLAMPRRIATGRDFAKTSGCRFISVPAMSA